MTSVVSEKEKATNIEPNANLEKKEEFAYESKLINPTLLTITGSKRLSLAKQLEVINMKVSPDFMAMRSQFFREMFQAEVPDRSVEIVEDHPKVAQALIVAMHSCERSSSLTHPFSFPAAKLATKWMLDEELKIYRSQLQHKMDTICSSYEGRPKLTKKDKALFWEFVDLCITHEGVCWATLNGLEMTGKVMVVRLLSVIDEFDPVSSITLSVDRDAQNKRDNNFGYHCTHCRKWFDDRNGRGVNSSTGNKTCNNCSRNYYYHKPQYGAPQKKEKMPSLYLSRMGEIATSSHAELKMFFNVEDIIAILASHSKTMLPGPDADAGADCGNFNY